MTQEELKQIAGDAGGVLALAARLRVGKDWVYRRIRGGTPIGHKDELALRSLQQNCRESVQNGASAADL